MTLKLKYKNALQIPFYLILRKNLLFWKLNCYFALITSE